MDMIRGDERDREIWMRLAEAERRLMAEIAERQRLQRQLARLTSQTGDIKGRTA